ncbi:hypothetical protein AAC387_Pa04g0003 [Persea americana]
MFMLFLMSTCAVLCENVIIPNRRRGQQLFRRAFPSHHAPPSSNSLVSLFPSGSGGKKRLSGLIPNAKSGSSSSGKRTWWQKFFLDDAWDWFGLKEDDMLEEPQVSTPTGQAAAEGERQLSEEESFEAWKRRAEAISELREAQEDVRNMESREWEDWLMEGTPGAAAADDSSRGQDWEEATGLGDRAGDIPMGPGEIMPGRGMAGTMRDLVFRNDEDELLYEDRVFRFASINSGKFLALLVIIPWTLDFVVHDYVLMPFLDRYVKTVPLAAEILDVRRHQKLEMIKTLEVEKARFRFEVEIGKSPPLSDEEVWWALRHKAIELRDEWRLENRRAFANILSDMVFGIALFILVYFNQSKVALLKFTGYKLLNNISDTGKAFLIILVTDIFLGYHSESGWQTLIEIILEHYGLEVDQAAITIFVCFVPVVIDACVKLWLFKFLPRLSPNITNIFREMKRH